MKDNSVAAGLCFRQAFPLFEQFSEATQGWEFDFRQLSVASSPFLLEQFSTPRMLYSRAAFTSHFHQRGGPVLGFRTFALHTEHCTDYRWCGQAVNRHCLVVLPADGEFESISQPGFDIFTLSLSNTLLEHIAQTQFQRSLLDFMGRQGLVCHRAGNSIRELRKSLHGVSCDIAHHQNSPVPLQIPGARSLMEESLAYLVLACLDNGDTRESREPHGKRVRTLARALELVDSAGAEAIRVPDLVAHTGVSRRTLEHAFQDVLNISPSAYLKALRLNALQRELLAASNGSVSVQSVCREHGFHHLGQLATDYRQFFGELPSATLRRN